MHKDGIPFKVCIHFARNHGAVLFTDDIATRWNIGPKDVWARMKAARAKGWVESHKDGRETYYVAGKTLIEAMK